jgi:hypothetical protein
MMLKGWIELILSVWLSYLCGCDFGYILLRDTLMPSQSSQSAMLSLLDNYTFVAMPLGINRVLRRSVSGHGYGVA